MLLFSPQLQSFNYSLFSCLHCQSRTICSLTAASKATVRTRRRSRMKNTIIFLIKKWPIASALFLKKKLNQSDLVILWIKKKGEKHVPDDKICTGISTSSILIAQRALFDQYQQQQRISAVLIAIPLAVLRDLSYVL